MSQKKEATINNPYTDWQEAFDKIENKDQMTIIELGCGEGTKYLTDNFKEVISIEFSRYPYDFTVTSPNHTFVELKPLKSTIEGDSVIIENKGKIRPKFVYEINLLINEIKKHKADFVFVDFGFHFRSEVVQELIDLGKYKYIAYHDSNYPYYGYDNIDCKNYTKQEDKMGQGTIILNNKPLPRS